MEEAWESAVVSEYSKILKVESEKEDSRYVPVHIERPLLEECGYRCSVHTCRGTSALQLEHIEDWAKLSFKKHDFEKMIVLCATCHARVTSKEIHKNAIRAYKRNLAVVNGRYSLFEMRLLELYRGKEFSSEGDFKKFDKSAFLMATDSDLLHLGGLLRDGYIEAHPLKDGSPFPVKDGKIVGGTYDGLDANMLGEVAAKLKNTARYLILPTQTGVEFVQKFFGGEEI